VEAASDGADGNAEQFGDVGVAHLLHVTEDDGLAVVGREDVESAADALDLLSLGETLEGVGFGGGQVVVELDGLRGAELAEEEVAGHAVEVAAEAADGGVVAAGATDEGEEDLLDDIVGNDGVAAHAEGIAVDAGLVTPVEEFEGLLVARLEAGEQGVFIPAVRGDVQRVSVQNCMRRRK